MTHPSLPNGSMSTKSGQLQKVKRMFQDTIIDELKETEFIFGLPEYRIALPGGKRPSPNDIFVLAKNQSGLVVIMVEGKASEPFGPYVKDWILQDSDTKGRASRLTFLASRLQLSPSNVESIRYQLLHRAVSVVIQSEILMARLGIMLVHCFGPVQESYKDYSAFLELFGLSSTQGSFSGPVKLPALNLYFGWVQDTIDISKEGDSS